MLHLISRRRLYMCAALWLVLTTPPASLADMPQTIGQLDSKSVLVFEGNRTFPKDQLCTALYSDKDVILAISPAASLRDYLGVLESKIRLGYLNVGFFSPAVRAAYVAEPEHILISIEEGPRYTKGDLVIEGASDPLKNALHQSLNKLGAEGDETSGLPEFINNIGTKYSEPIVRPVSPDELNALEANLAKGIHQTFLASKGRPSFAPSLPETSKAYLHTLLKGLGYYRCEFTVEMIPNHSEKTASPHIVFQNEGVRAQVGTINIVGNTINSNAQILSCLGIETGQPLNEMLTEALRANLVNSGRFRLAAVRSEINPDDPPQSILHISVEEVALATALDGTLTEKEELMQKVGRFMDRYQSWEQDVRIRFDFEQAAKDLDAEKLQAFKDKVGIPLPDIEFIYSPQRGVIITELINGTDILNAFVITPEQTRFICPLLEQNVFSPALENGLLVVFDAGPSKPSSLPDQSKWYLSMGMGMATDVHSFSTRVSIHPGIWFDMANDPEKEITFIDQTRAQIQYAGTKINIDRQSGEIIKIESDFVTAIFEKDLFNSQLEQLEQRCRETNLKADELSSPVRVLFGSLLPLCLTHIPNDTMTLAQKIEATRTLDRLLSGLAGCHDNDEDSDETDERDSFSLPMNEQLAFGGMMPVLLGGFYQSCHDNLPKDSWVRTLMHAAVLMASGYAQHPSVGQDLQQIYNSDQIGPVGYLITAQFLGQLGYPASNAFAQRGLQVLDAEHFRKDWQPLLTKESNMKQWLLSCLEQFQAGSDEGIRLAASLLPEQYAAPVTAFLERLREVQADSLDESLDSILTESWETGLKEQLHQQLNAMAMPKQAKKDEPPETAQPSEETNSPEALQALRELEKRAEAGDLKALVERGRKYLESDEKDNPFKYKDALCCFKMAAEQNDADGQYYLGRMYYYGIGVKQDFAEALKWYTKASEQNHAQATYELNVMYERGEGVEPDEKKSIALCTKAAELGFAHAQNSLGQRYAQGRGVPKDYAECFKWLQKAAEQGFAEAQYNLGAFYLEGIEVEKDPAEALRWFQKAAEQGYPMAIYNVGTMYLYGWGVEQDYDEAVKWWHKAAETGLAVAQFSLGKAYQQGDGVQRDYAESLKWYTMAALQQFPGAWNELGRIYEFGFGVEADYAKAFEYYTKSIELGTKGHPEFNLARLYYVGKGTEIDYVQACKWAIVAGVNGEYNEEFLNSVEAEMTPKQIAESRRLANEYVEQNKDREKNNTPSIPIIYPMNN